MLKERNLSHSCWQKVRFRTFMAWGLLSLIACITSCSDEDDGTPYPSVLTELADIHTNDEGTMTKMTLDNGVSYQLSNPQKGYKKNVRYRAVCNYVPSGETARIYRMDGAHFLRDSSAVGVKDPTPVVSAWRAGKYINMQLAPLTQGGVQYWGFIIDKVEPGHAFVSLHHRQNGDPLSYTQPSYASLPVDSIKDIKAGERITLSITTLKGERTWEFLK